MSTLVRHFERDGHTYELHMIDADPVCHLYEDFGDEAALVGSVTQRGTHFSIECYWRPEPGSHTHDVDAATVDEAVSALIALTAGEDPRGSA